MVLKIEEAKRGFLRGERRVYENWKVIIYVCIFVTDPMTSCVCCVIETAEEK